LQVNPATLEIAMRRLSLPFVILASVVIALCLTGYALAEGPDQRAEGQPETQALAPFKRIEISGSARVTLVQDTNGPLVATVPPDTSASVHVRVQNGTLIIESVEGARWWGQLFRGASATPQITIHFKDLEAIDVSGGVRITAKEIRVPALSVEGSGGTTIQFEDLRATRLSVSGSGALKAELGGEVTEQSVSLSGAADFQAAKLISDNASVDVSGAGKVVVNARKKLQARISGAGVVEYLGDPVVQQSISGVGRVKRRQATGAAPAHIAQRD
jgi:hypothetical protein